MPVNGYSVSCGFARLTGDERRRGYLLNAEDAHYGLDLPFASQVAHLSHPNSTIRLSKAFTTGSKSSFSQRLVALIDLP